MIRMIVIPLLLLGLVLNCTGQTFQYSRGWTNGKRSSSHDLPFPETMEIESGKKLEKCLFNLQRFLHNSYLRSPTFPGGTNKFQNGHHQSNEILDDVGGPDSLDYIKRQI